MKKTTKILLSAALTATVCASLIVGSTLALFQSKTENTLVVTSGNINVTAALGQPTVTAKGSKLAEPATAIGSAGTEGSNKITLTNFTPGDCATFDITVTNSSTIKTTWQLTVEKESGDDTLYNALTFSVSSDNAPFSDHSDLKTMDGGSKKGTDWGTVNAPSHGSETVTLHVTVQFPDTAGDGDSTTLMGKNCTFKITLHVMQGNAKTQNPEAA